MTPDQSAELVRRLSETLRQAQSDGLIAGDDGDANSIVSGWVLVLESVAGEDSKWLHRLASPGLFPWQWRGYLNEAAR